MLSINSCAQYRIIDKQLRTIQDYLDTHPEDPNYVPPPKKRRESREDTCKPFSMMIDVDAWASIFWEEASVEFKSWWKSQQGKQYQAKIKPFWGFMKGLHRMFENPSLDDEQLTSHLWNIILPVQGFNGRMPTS
uniref:Transposase n=1 Tax=Romanomermis culicivorax TaxID=13658 RepID=A0A915III3_ROMCU